MVAFHSFLTVLAVDKAYIHVCFLYHGTGNIISSSLWHGPILWGSWSAVLVLSALVFETFSEIKENKSLNILGNISYSIYSTYAMVIEVFHKYTDTFTLFNEQKGFSTVIYLVLISLFVAYIAFRFIEQPCILVGRKLNNFIDSKFPN